MTPKEILAENWDAIEGICRRLPAEMMVAWNEQGLMGYYLENEARSRAVREGEIGLYAKAKEQKLRGQRLVVIVTASETLYQFV